MIFVLLEGLLHRPIQHVSSLSTYVMSFYLCYVMCCIVLLCFGFKLLGLGLGLELGLAMTLPCLYFVLLDCRLVLPCLSCLVMTCNILSSMSTQRDRELKLGLRPRPGTRCATTHKAKRHTTKQGKDEVRKDYGST